MNQTAIEKLTEEVNAFIKDNLKPEMLVDVIKASDGIHESDQARVTAISHAVMGVAGVLLAVQKVEIYEDKVEGLEADLFEAVQVAYNRGAEEWARLNYPSWIERLEANKRAEEERKQC